MNKTIKILNQMIEESKEIAHPWGECHEAILVKARDKISSLPSIDVLQRYDGDDWYGNPMKGDKGCFVLYDDLYNLIN